jgi:ribosomal protein S18 acetylase RimI-like enzyme
MRGDTVRIRPAASADVERFREIHRAAYAELSGELYDARSAAWEHGFFAARLAHPVDIEVAVRSDAVVGAVYVEQRADEVYVESLEVSPDCQGRGVGSALLDWAAGWAIDRGLPVSLQVHRGNPHARRLHERLGFRVVREAGAHLEMRRAAPPSSAPSRETDLALEDDGPHTGERESRGRR